MLIGIHDKETGKNYHICGGFPSASGKTNLAMMLAPDALGDRYHVVVLRRRHRLAVGRRGRRQALRDEPGVRRLRRRQGHQREHQPDRAATRSTRAPARSSPTSPTTRRPSEVWWEGRTPQPPADVDGWLDWKGDPIADRENGDDSPWAHPNSRFTTTLANVPNIAPDFDDPAGVPIDAIIFGGRTRDREPLIRAITDLAEGVYDGLTLGAEATSAAEGVEGAAALRPDVECGRSCPTPRATTPRTG